VKSAFELRHQISNTSRELHARGWVANHDGNVSHRLPRGAGLLITPTAISKRDTKADGLATVSMAGEPSGKQKPPSEVQLHVGAYRARAEVMAVIHAHPPEASAFALAGRSLGPIAMPEVVVSLGAELPLVPLLLPKDSAAAGQVEEALRYADAALLAGNGVITVGVDLEQALLRMELVEHYAKILSRALALGAPLRPLPEEALTKLLEMRAKAGLVVRPAAPKAASKASGALRAIVGEEVRRALGGKS
jgi:L-fuculose-phosphate aldolase